uniref:Plectin-like n=1 Tax=Petromyzon marinus TaxID=7757 RepID=A0AAJ7TQV2_PETMA|nr:plectin-like [Petromyzon marinus]
MATRRRGASALGQCASAVCEGRQDAALALHGLWHTTGTARPCLAEFLELNLFGENKATQTEASDICALQELRATVRTLTMRLSELEQELQLQKRFLRAEYEENIRDKASELHAALNQKLRHLETLHEERLNTARRSFRQQLDDALVQRDGAHKDSHGQRQAEGGCPAGSDAKLQVARLRERLEEQEALAKRLTLQLEALREEEGDQPSPTPPVDTTDLEEAARLAEENMALQLALSALQSRVEASHSALLAKEQQSTELENEIVKIKEKMNRQCLTLQEERDGLRAALEREQALHSSQLQKQRESLEKEAKQRLSSMKMELRAEKQRTAEAEALAKREAAEKEAVESKKREVERESLSLKDAHRAAETAQASAAARASAKSKRESPRSWEGGAETEDQRAQITRLMKQLERTNKMWEQKFAVLQQSLHAVKDEMFLRTSLQRQAAILHHAAVGYTPYVSQQVSSPSGGGGGWKGTPVGSRDSLWGSGLFLGTQEEPCPLLTRPPGSPATAK